MKKILSIILSVLIILAMLTPVAFASGEITVVSPGASCTTDLNKIQIECDNASKIIFELDGEKIGETNGEEELALSDGTLTVGNHTLKVSAIYPDKTASVKEHKFSARKIVTIKSKQQNFDELGDTLDKNKLNADMQLYNVGLCDVMPDTGKDGYPGDKSYKMQMNTTNAVSGGSSPYARYRAFENYGRKGILTFDFDIKVSDVNKVNILLYDMPLFNVSPNLMKDGKILASAAAVKEGWQHMKIVIDHTVNSSGIVTFTHDTDVIYNDVANPHPGSLGASYVQFGFRQSGGNKEAVWLDNFDFKQELVYSLEKVSYSDGSSWSEYINSLPVSAKALKLHLSSNMDASTINKNAVSVYENGAKVQIDDVIYNDSEKTVTVVPSQSFSKDSDIVVEFNSNVKLAGSTEVLPLLNARLITEAPSLTPISVDFKKGSSALISSAQLESGDSVSADVVLNNDTDEAKNMSVILLVRQNKKLRAIAAVETTLSPHTTSPVTVLIPDVGAIDAQGDVSVKLAICDTVANSVPYMSYTEIN